MCFVCYYSETKNKVGKERRQAYPFSSCMICLVVHGAKGGREKKNDDDKKWNCKSTPFHYLPISASLELLEWTLGDLINHVSSSKSQGRDPSGFWHLLGDESSSGPDFEASTSIQELRCNTPEMWLRKRQQKPNNSSWHLSSSLCKKKKRTKEEKKPKENKIVNKS